MHPYLDHDLYDVAVLTIFKTYSSFSYKPQHSQWTILASFFLSRQDDLQSDVDDSKIKIIGLATGTKCLPATRLSSRGEVLHDCHAEVLARRATLKWFLEEIMRIRASENGTVSSQWIVEGTDGKYTLRVGVQLNLYVSTLPCGDASMRYLAGLQDEGMATLKNFDIFPNLDPTATSRGRDNYSRLGALRTKPGRADSPPTLCMSCSDKIARWNALGIQGALSSRFLSPLYIGTMIIGEVPPDMEGVVREDCERAFWKRLDDLADHFSVHHPTLHFTNLPFVHSRSALGSSTSCNESLCWTADSRSFEVIINGLKRGVSPKDRYREKSRPRLSKIALFNLYKDVLHSFGDSLSSSTSATQTYLQVKLASKDYQTAKNRLIGKDGPFSGWVPTGIQWQIFNINGDNLSASPTQFMDTETAGSISS
ncbi:hypothetical protein CPB84DRAFT_1721009 [Gymnopilus junonius]|uniref:A to I editase domain-containing protein n=1 Tax=Gymnopilus junonius TaxID=109634 RepID=A0A9P5TVY4_GYMJU|nr:hypothetical protein CPB84DRAFT_1721009 [Gymnopilus junonius]